MIPDKAGVCSDKVKMSLAALVGRGRSPLVDGVHLASGYKAENQQALPDACLVWVMGRPVHFNGPPVDK